MEKMIFLKTVTNNSAAQYIENNAIIDIRLQPQCAVTPYIPISIYSLT